MRSVLLGVLAEIGLSMALALPSTACAQDDPPVARMDERTAAAIERGLEVLAARQNPDGSFGIGAYRGNVAVCALAGMAFMSHGDLPGRGKYGEQVKSCTRYLLANAGPSGFIYNAEAGTHGPMYGHGFATLYLAEAYGSSPDTRLREQLTRAVKLICDTQNKEGGWRYLPEALEADISVTVCQVMALRSARNAGLFVPSETIDRCVEYVKRCQNADGGFMYMLSQPGESQFPRSAAGIVSLYSAGIYQGPEIEKGIDYLLQRLPGKGARENYYFYGHYYAVQAMWQAGGDPWQKWYPAIREELLARQTKDGIWIDAISPEYGTAMACLILQTPQSHLPIFQR